MTVRSFLRATSSRRRVIAAGAGAAVATAFPTATDASAPAKGARGQIQRASPRNDKARRIAPPRFMSAPCEEVS